MTKNRNSEEYKSNNKTNNKTNNFNKINRIKTKNIINEKGGDTSQLMNDAYDATATVGRIMSWINLVVGIIIGIIFIIVGIVILRNKTPSYDSSTIATITAVSCSGSGNNSSCTLTISYTVNDKTITNNIIQNGVYNVDQTLKIKYNSANPQEISTDTISNTAFGWIIIVIGILIIIGVCIWTYVVQINKTIAAASGVGNVVGIATDGFGSTNNTPDFNSN